MKQNVNALICLLNDITHIKSKQKKANGKKTSEGKHEKRVRKKKHYIILPAAVATAKNMSTSNRNNNNNKQRGKAATAQPQTTSRLKSNFFQKKFHLKNAQISLSGVHYHWMALSVVDLFAVESSEATVEDEGKTEEEEEIEEEPNTEDRRFIKNDSEPASVSEYVPTDPEEFSDFSARTPVYSANTTNARGNHRESKTDTEEQETKQNRVCVKFAHKI